MFGKMKKQLDRLMMRMMITCEKASYLISKSQDEKLTFPEHFQLRMHLLGCRFCRAYEKDIGILSDNIQDWKHYIEDEGHPIHMPGEEKQKIREHIREQQNGGDQAGKDD